ncbi:MAG: PEP-CTERM sorting domain-containing protein [Immundisolibacteraceae bacterium]|nr:PEP-CTERM sorting domain-containing protein [Immundisolibacteraceae bacterium]
MKSYLGRLITMGVALVGSMSAFAAPIYLNDTNISVSVGSGTSAGSFNNTFNGTSTIEKVIDAPSADAEEFHNQTTHIWFTAASPGGGLELLFDFGVEYDITTLHFWNYTSESFDVDNVDFTFFNNANLQVGALSIAPALGSSGGISAEDIALAAPLNVQYVTAFLTGSNQQVDFQNIGFTADLSTPVPEPGVIYLLAFGLLILFASRKAHRVIA